MATKKAAKPKNPNRRYKKQDNKPEKRLFFFSPQINKTDMDRTDLEENSLNMPELTPKNSMLDTGKDDQVITKAFLERAFDSQLEKFKCEINNIMRDIKEELQQLRKQLQENEACMTQLQPTIQQHEDIAKKQDNRVSTMAKKIAELENRRNNLRLRDIPESISQDRHKNTRHRHIKKRRTSGKMPLDF
ncbi:Hypothetical predicted protein [Pelobates cultripes]|uniref:Uncharacterized protein n=1 Tax=Pelobates cultripes TaxID=61616 RepID=A0AAD1W7P6_PELCU|nr:Hypothetical predicted protein [Pelobates cultripes]